MKFDYCKYTKDNGHSDTNKLGYLRILTNLKLNLTHYFVEYYTTLHAPIQFESKLLTNPDSAGSLLHSSIMSSVLLIINTIGDLALYTTQHKPSGSTMPIILSVL